MSQTQMDPMIDSQTFVAVMWSGVVISLFCLVFRIFVRIKCFRRIYADDVLVLIAWLMFLCSAVIYQSQQAAMYELFTIASGTVIPTSEQLVDQRTFLRTQVTTIFLFLTSLWIVKLSFLVFFRRLGQNFQGQKTWWWCITGFTIATWATCIGIIPFKCLIRSLDYIFTKCGVPSERKSQWVIQYYNCIIDVITDAAIITIPIFMLWNVHISWRKRLALMGIFSLTIVVVVFSIVRIALVKKRNSAIDVSWGYMWGNIEVAVSIVVSCLASFRQLFVKTKQSGIVPQSDDIPLWRRARLSAFKSSSLSSRDERSLARKIVRSHRTVPVPDSTENIVPLDTVYVRHDSSKSSSIGQS